jgi:dTDP-4-amino-4,6-dideoxygalactose transaminase
MECGHSAHIFYVKLRNLGARNDFIQGMKEKNITCSFHFLPLHSSPAGIRLSRFHGEDRYTTTESERLVRLPISPDLSREQFNYIVQSVAQSLKNRS